MRHNEPQRFTMSHTDSQWVTMGQSESRWVRITHIHNQSVAMSSNKFLTQQKSRPNGISLAQPPWGNAEARHGRSVRRNEGLGCLPRRPDSVSTGEALVSWPRSWMKMRFLQWFRYILTFVCTHIYTSIYISIYPSIHPSIYLYQYLHLYI